MTNPISRRALLRGAGVAVGLPFLDAMLPARAAAPAPRRLAVLYVPSGVSVPHWAPSGEGEAFRLSATMSPLQPFRDSLQVISGLDHRRADIGGNGHDLACSTLLSTAPLGRKDRAGYATDVSVDQLIARTAGAASRLPSLELGCDADGGRIHVANISWRGPCLPMGREINPRYVFARLFGDPQGDAHRRSVLDYVGGRAASLRSSLGRVDREKMDEYLDGVRSVERRIQAVERDPKRPPPPAMALPSAVPDDRREHLRILLDLLVLAFRTDTTRVATFMFAAEGSERAFPQLGVREGHHALTHMAGRPGVWELLQKIDVFYLEQLAYFLEKARSVREGEGTLLDSLMVLYTSGLSHGGLHSRRGMPVVLAGKGGGTLRGGRHLRVPDGTPFANLLLSLADRMGVPLDAVSDSTGPRSAPPGGVIPAPTARTDALRGERARPPAASGNADESGLLPAVERHDVAAGDPFCRGGTHREENLRLLCALHNRREAERSLGGEWMRQFY